MYKEAAYLVRRMMVFITAFSLFLACVCISHADAQAVKEGMRGELVKNVQTLLIDKGYLNEVADGICGKNTVAAIKSFQAAEGLEVDGICGERTYGRLSGGKSFPVVKSQAGHHGRTIYVSATAYSPQDPGLNPRTATGELLRRGIIAVDPSFIPLGTRVYIPGYGEAVAADIGGGIRGNIIDVAFDTHQEALMFGRRDLEITLLD